ncbi:hypothetical protein [Robiginitalea sp. IMCC43444]|uniref:hypothetical protein n=1 Tax=Robiginitalea sp. IMCC43444 TaxID=3459121 RepID=UPI0040412B7A
MDGVIHNGFSIDATTVLLYVPQFIGNFTPYGSIAGSEFCCERITSVIMFGAQYKW